MRRRAKQSQVTFLEKVPAVQLSAAELNVSTVEMRQWTGG